VVPPGPDPDPHPIADKARQRKALPPLRPLPEAVPAAGRQHPLSRTSACAARPATPQQQPRRRRPVPDRVRRDLADRDHEILRPGRRQARPHRSPRRNPAHWPRVISTEPHPHGTGKPAAPARPADSTTFPYPGQAPKQADRIPCSQGCDRPW